MAYDDALFQLGMDLDPGSSTAQTEEKTVSRAAEADERKDYFCERDGIRFAGTHLIVDLMNAKHIDNVAHVEETFRRCVDEAGATLLNIDMHHFTPNGGVTGVAILAESHISIHSWPEYGYAALDIFMCGEADPHAAIPVLREAFEPEEVVVTEHLRGRHVLEVAEAA